jgi:hypothetical protein
MYLVLKRIVMILMKYLENKKNINKISKFNLIILRVMNKNKPKQMNS